MGFVVMGIRGTKKSLQKRAQRARRARGEKRTEPTEHEKPIGQQLWFQEMSQPTAFDIVQALQEELQTESLGVPHLDSWGVTLFLVLIFQFFTSAHAATWARPYRLPKAPLGEQNGPDMPKQGSAPSVAPVYPINDLYEFFASTRGGGATLFEGSDAAQSDNEVATDPGRVKRSGDDRHQHVNRRVQSREGDHDHDHQDDRSDSRPNAEETPDPLQDAIVYPADKLSSWMRGLMTSVESASAVLEPALRKIGFDPDETLEVSVIQRATIASPTRKTITALEFAEHVTTKGHVGYSYEPTTARGRELHSILTDSEEYGTEGFFSKAALHPIRHKFRHEGLDAIAEKLLNFGVFLDNPATLYYVQAIPKFKIGLRSSMERRTNAELGNLIRVGGTINKYFAIIPHHPDLVIPTPDPSETDKWAEWMGATGRFLFFRDQSKLPKGTPFTTVQEDPGNIEHPSHSVRGAVFHTLKPIVAKTVRHMSDLIVKETPTQRIMDYFNSFFIPIYDIAKSVVEEQHAKVVVLLGLELIPYAGKGGKALFKASVKSGAGRAAAGHVAQLAGRVFSDGKNIVAPAVVDRVANEINRSG